MQEGAVIASYTASVRVDGRAVCSIRRGVRPSRGPRALSIVRERRRETPASLALRDGLRLNKPAVLDWTRNQVKAYFFVASRKNRLPT